MGYFPKLKGIFCLSVASAVLAGCTVNPTPKGVKYGKIIQDYSVDIVKRVRCEARDAMVVEAADVVRRIALAAQSAGKSGAHFINQTNLSKRLLENPGHVKEINIWEIDPRAHVIASPILNSALGLKFIFTGTINHNSSLSPKLTSTTGPHVFSLGITTLNNNRKFKNMRTMTVGQANFSTFQYLDCPGDKNNRKRINNKRNSVYPVNGNIELNKTITNFIDFYYLSIDRKSSSGPDAIRRAKFANDSLTEAAKIAKLHKITPGGDGLQVFRKAGKLLEKCETKSQKSKQEKQLCDAKQACYEEILSTAGKIFTKKYHNEYNSYFSNISGSSNILSASDILTFTTEIKGGLEPSVKFSAAGNFDLESVGFTYSPGRTDVHQVQVSQVSSIPETDVAKSVNKDKIGQCSAFRTNVVTSKIAKLVKKSKSAEKSMGFVNIQNSKSNRDAKAKSFFDLQSDITTERLINSGARIPIN